MHSSDLTFTDRSMKQKSLAAAADDYERAHRKDIADRNAEMKAVVTDYAVVREGAILLTSHTIQAKNEKQRTLAEEKRRDMEQLKSYDPWGKPGGGAPSARHSHTHHLNRYIHRWHVWRLTSRQGNNALVDTHHSMERQLSQTRSKTYVDQVFGHEGGGAPLRDPRTCVLWHLDIHSDGEQGKAQGTAGDRPRDADQQRRALQPQL